MLAGGQGTRLRPLTVHTPKPVVPIFERPFLHYQLDLLKRVPEIDEVILSLNYQPRKIEDVFGDGTDAGVRLRYVVEPAPLGTGGAIRYAAQGITGTVVVFNSDVLTSIDIAAVVQRHRERNAKATVVLTPVDNPTAYGLVETDAAGNIRRFIEKPSANEISCNTVNAGIYVLETDTFDRIPEHEAYSIERGYFPSLVERGETFVSYLYDGYWIDIGTPEKYVQVHRDIMAGRCRTAPFTGAPDEVWVSPRARVDDGAFLQGPCFIDDGAVVMSGATVGPYSVIGKQCHVEADARVQQSILWANTRVCTGATVTGAVLGRHCHVGRHASVAAHAVIGDKTVLTDYSRS